MQPPTKRQLLIPSSPSGFFDRFAGAPEIGRMLAALEEVRHRTWAVLDGVSEAELDWHPPAETGANSLGTLLYHIALIEADWVYADIVQYWPPDLLALLPWEVRDEKGRLTVVAGLDVAEHRQRLDRVREFVHAAYANLPAEHFHQPCATADYDVTPAWALHHLMQHEAEHRGEMRIVRELFRHSFDTVL